MSKKYLLFSLEDKRIKTIAEILGNKTSAKIIDLLSETKEASEKDIADSLDVPINTVEYNLKKMIFAGIVEETKNFFWSQKGRKIKMYRFSNKSILISPKQKNVFSSFKQIVPIAMISGIASVALKFYFQTKSLAQDSFDESTALYAVAKSTEVGNSFISANEHYWLWFAVGSFFSIALFIIAKSIISYTGEK